MNNEELAHNFSLIHDELKTYTEKALYVLKLPLDSSHVLAECYLHVHKHQAELEHTGHLAAYSKNWIKSNLNWTRSPINLKLAKRPNHTSEFPDTLYTDSILPDIESWISEWESKLTLQEQTLWKIYYYLDKKNSNRIAVHLEISGYMGNRLIKQAKQLEASLREFVLEKITETP